MTASVRSENDPIVLSGAFPISAEKVEELTEHLLHPHRIEKVRVVSQVHAMFLTVA